MRAPTELREMDVADCGSDSEGEAEGYDNVGRRAPLLALLRLRTATSADADADAFVALP